MFSPLSIVNCICRWCDGSLCFGSEAAAEYIRSKGYDVAAADLQPLGDDDLENVSGGGNLCIHKWKYLNKEKEESYYFFWTKRYKWCQCTTCGLKLWVAEECAES